MRSRGGLGIGLVVFVLWWTVVAQFAPAEVATSARAANIAVEQPVTFRIVALTGQPVSGGPAEATLGRFGSAVINNAGHVAFIGNIEVPYHSSNNAILADRGAGIEMVALSGTQVPVMEPGFLFAGFNRRPVLNDQGHLVFPSSAFRPGTNGAYSMCFWRESYRTWSIEAQQGQQAPDTPPGTRFNLDIYACPVDCDPLGTPVCNNAGQIAFWSDLTGEGIIPTNSAGIWSTASGNLRLVARLGDQAPGTADGVVFSRFWRPGVGGSGHVVFWAVVDGSGITYKNSLGIWSDRSGSLHPVVRTGEPAPGLPAGSLFEHVPQPTSNEAGQTAFWGRVRLPDNNSLLGIWSEGTGSMRLLALQGLQAPGTSTGVTFAEFPPPYPLINDAGRTVFCASLVGAGLNGSNNTGIWSDVSGSLALVARAGQQAPGLPEGTVFGSLVGFKGINNLGQILVWTTAVLPGTPPTYQAGIWAADAGGQLRRVVCHGDTLEAAPGDFRTIRDILFHDPPACCEGGRRFFNDRGEFAFTAVFEDDTEALVVATIPQVRPLSLSLDIRPGNCPNPLNLGSKGVLPVAILGTVDFDVSLIDPATITLSIADGNGSAAPVAVPVVKDVAAPLDGQTCECGDLGPDGIPDLFMKFSVPDVAGVVTPCGVPGGTVIELVVSGSLCDGSPFTAKDCVLIVPVRKGR